MAHSNLTSLHLMLSSNNGWSPFVLQFSMYVYVLVPSGFELLRCRVTLPFSSKDVLAVMVVVVVMIRVPGPP